jgi:hypothetical protein
MGSKIHQIAVINYSPDPGPRYVCQGEHSGEDYYHKVLNIEFYTALESEKILKVLLDGTSGYASSFLDEAFGNLVYDFTLDKVKRNITIISKEEPEWKDMIENESFKEWENRRIKEITPKKTVEHLEWFRYEGNKFVKKVWIKK